MFGKLFKQSGVKKIQTFETECFSAWNVQHPTNEQRLRFHFMLACACAAEFNGLPKAIAKKQIDRMFKDVAESVKDLRPVFISKMLNLQLDTVEFDEADFRQTVGLSDEVASTNGLGAIEGLLNTYGQEMMEWLIDSKNGPFGSLGASALMIREVSTGLEATDPSALLGQMAVSKGLANFINDYTSG